MRPKKLTIACFFDCNTERWPVYFRPGAMFGIFVLIHKNRTGQPVGLERRQVLLIA